MCIFDSHIQLNGPEGAAAVEGEENAKLKPEVVVAVVTGAVVEGKPNPDGLLPPKMGAFPAPPNIFLLLRFEKKILAKQSKVQ